MDYSLRITDASNTMLHVEYLKTLSLMRIFISIEERLTIKEHIHAFLTVTNSQVKQIRDYLKNHVSKALNKRPFSFAKRRGNLLAYIMKDYPPAIEEALSEWEKNDGSMPGQEPPILQDGELPILIDVTTIDCSNNQISYYLYSAGWCTEDLIKAYQESYPKGHSKKKASFETLKSLYLANYEKNHLSSTNEQSNISHYQYRRIKATCFQNDLITFYINNHKTPPRFSYVSYLLIKYNYITPDEYSTRCYPSFF